MRQKIVLSHLHNVGAFVLAHRETKRMRRWLAWCRANKRNVKFITLTYDLRPYQDRVHPEKLPEYMYDLAKDGRHVARFMDRVSEFTRTPMKAKWRAKMEFHSSGILHFHLLVRDMPYVKQHDLQNIWGHGIVDVRKAKIKHAGYIAKYQSKAGGYPAFLYDKPRRSVQVWGTSHGFFNVVDKDDRHNPSDPPEEKEETQAYDIAGCEQKRDYDPNETIGSVLKRAGRTFVVKDEAGEVKEFIARDNEVICALWMMKFERVEKKWGWYEYDMTWHHFDRVMEQVHENRHLQDAMAKDQLMDLAYCDDDYIANYEKELGIDGCPSEERPQARSEDGRKAASFSCLKVQDCAHDTESACDLAMRLSAEYHETDLSRRELGGKCGIPQDMWPDEYAPF
ncbi:rolling circle replication-associated protein [Poriferisphaera sp. WC338]|uniref:rolling circle replication-associated protein n=1 Tax=Poriferisphaera sp. WC338 TaxID=3425129 RepID=UPI003D8187F7